MIASNGIPRKIFEYMNAIVSISSLDYKIADGNLVGEGIGGFQIGITTG